MCFPIPWNGLFCLFRWKALSPPCKCWEKLVIQSLTFKNCIHSLIWQGNTGGRESQGPNFTPNCLPNQTFFLFLSFCLPNQTFSLFLNFSLPYQTISLFLNFCLPNPTFYISNLLLSNLSFLWASAGQTKPFLFLNFRRTKPNLFPF